MNSGATSLRSLSQIAAFGASMIFMGGEQESHRGTKWVDGSTQPEPRINLADEISTEAAELEETVEQTESAE